MDAESPDTTPPEGTGSDPPGDVRMPWSVRLLLGFLVLALVALAVLPVHHARAIADVESSLAEVLEPAGDLSSRLRLTQAEQMAALQAFILSGEGRFRQRYREARQREEAVYDSLYALAGEMDLPVRERMIRLWSLSFRWHVNHTPVIYEEIPRGEFRSYLPEEQRLYEEILRSSSELGEAIQDGVRQARTRMDELRSRQIWATGGLVLLALAATLAVGYLGRRLLSLAREAEKRREDAVRARREVDAVLEATGEGVLGMDMDGRCTFLNRAGGELLGLPTRFVMGQEVHPLIHHTRPDGSSCSSEECPILAIRETGEPVRLTDEILWRPDGDSFPAQISARPMVDGRQVKGVVVTFSDLTEIREAEQALRRAVRAREEVVAVVSHDLRNPLGTITAGAELLVELDLPPERRREHLAGIRRAAERMNRMIRDLLDVSRIEAGGLKVDARPTPPARLLQEAAEMARPLTREASLKLECETAEELPSVAADRDRILQVFSNLVGNAVKFTPGGGTIRLAACRGDGGVVFEVADTGPGIAPEDQEYLFDRFWQVDRSDREGAGLGLAIVRGIVEAHEGRVWVESSPGEGSRFRFALPAADGDDGSGTDEEEGAA